MEILIAVTCSIFGRIACSSGGTVLSFKLLTVLHPASCRERTQKQLVSISLLEQVARSRPPSDALLLESRFSPKISPFDQPRLGREAIAAIA